MTHNPELEGDPIVVVVTDGYGNVWVGNPDSAEPPIQIELTPDSDTDTDIDRIANGVRRWLNNLERNWHGN